MPDRPTTSYAKEGDLRIAYQTVGDGPVDLVFAYGGQFPVDLVWEEPRVARFLRRLASFSRLVLLDSRGWGASRIGGGDTAPTVESWADDLRLVMDTVGVEQAALVGWYIGAFFSAFHAASQPERISRLVLIDGFARYLRSEDYPIGLPPAALDPGIDGFIDAYGTGADLDFFAPSLANERSFRDWWARCERLTNGPVPALNYFRDLAQRDLRSVLPALRMPTLVLQRRANPMVPVDHGRYLAEHIAGARYIELDGEHFFFARGSEQVLDEIESFVTGTRSGVDPDRVLAAVLFTDIVASTDQAAAVGDRRWRELLDHHDAVVASQVEKFRGRVIKTTGDGALATFDGPARAVRCACELREAVRQMGLRLRAGIHVGEIEQRSGDVAGIAVNLAARIQALAAPDEVMVSRTVVDLVAGSGISCADRGEHQLKGIPGQWQLFEVTG